MTRKKAPASTSTARAERSHKRMLERGGRRLSLRLSPAAAAKLEVLEKRLKRKPTSIIEELLLKE